MIDGWGICYKIVLMNITEGYWQVNIDWGHGLVPSGNKPLPEAMLTKI